MPLLIIAFQVYHSTLGVMAPNSFSGVRRGVSLLEARPRLPCRVVQPRCPPWSLSPIRYSSSSPGAGPSRPSRKRYYLLAIPLAFLPFTLFGTSRKPLDPYAYSDHEIRSSTRLTPQHAQVAIPLSPSDADKFRPPEKGEGDLVVIQHVMVKNPDLQIERPYTPINDVGEDGDIQLVVKRVKGGEVGR